MSIAPERLPDSVLLVTRTLRRRAEQGDSCVIICANENRVDAYRAELLFSGYSETMPGLFIVRNGAIRVTTDQHTESDHLIVHRDSSCFREKVA